MGLLAHRELSMPVRSIQKSYPPQEVHSSVRVHVGFVKVPNILFHEISRQGSYAQELLPSCYCLSNTSEQVTYSC